MKKQMTMKEWNEKVGEITTSNRFINCKTRFIPGYVNGIFNHIMYFNTVNRVEIDSKNNEPYYLANLKRSIRDIIDLNKDDICERDYKLIDNGVYTDAMMFKLYLGDALLNKVDFNNMSIIDLYKDFDINSYNRLYGYILYRVCDYLNDNIDIGCELVDMTNNGDSLYDNIHDVIADISIKIIKNCTWKINFEKSFDILIYVAMHQNIQYCLQYEKDGNSKK